MIRLFSVLLLILASCSTVPTSKFEQLAFGGDVFELSEPVIFVHGLALTGDYWADSKILDQLKDFGWTYGGDIKATDTEPLPAADIYTITFSTSELAIVQQGLELAKAIKAVKKATSASKVSLVGHSMGGLASREYMQSDYYQGDIETYISFGTPHAGTTYKPDKILFKLFPRKIRTLVAGVDFKSDAVRDLQPDSIYLNGGNEADSPDTYYNKDVNLSGSVGEDIVGLNQFELRPLPDDVLYINVIGAGDSPFISTSDQNKNSDGLVRILSQDMNELPGVNVSAISLISQRSHIFQADDVWVLLQAFRVTRSLRAWEASKS